MIHVVKLSKKQLELLNMGSAYFPTGSQYGYFQLPWAKLTIGTNKAEFYYGEKDIPAELRQMLEKDK